MKILPLVSASVILFGLNTVAPAGAQDRSLTLSDVHICCPACTKAIEGAIDKVDHVSVEVNKADRSVLLKGDDGVTREDAINALKAIAAAGFYGKSNREQFQMKDESEGMSGKVTSLALTGIHNCCGACDKGIKSAVASVEGTNVPEIAKQARDFTVTGDFDGAALIKAFNKAGFYVKVKKGDK